VTAAAKIGDQTRVADRLTTEGRRRTAGTPQMPLDPRQQGMLFHKKGLRIVLSLFLLVAGIFLLV
jgi:hypothetical protein